MEPLKLAQQTEFPMIWVVDLRFFDVDPKPPDQLRRLEYLTASYNFGYPICPTKFQG